MAFTLILAAGFTEHEGWPFVFLMLVAGAHMLWQVHTLDIDDSGTMPEAISRQSRNRRVDRRRADDLDVGGVNRMSSLEHFQRGRPAIYRVFSVTYFVIDILVILGRNYLT